MIIVAAAAFGILLGFSELELRLLRETVRPVSDSTVSVRLKPFKSARLESEEDGVALFLNGG